jgi:hypothetical protein
MNTIIRALGPFCCPGTQQGREPPQRRSRRASDGCRSAQTKVRKILDTTKRRITPQIKREFKRRAAIEPVIGHLKEHRCMGRNYLAHASGDAINAVLATAGYNFRRLLAWLRFLLLRILIALGLAAQLKLA